VEGSDVVLLLETMLAFADKSALVRAVTDALSPGGRFAFTVEEGRPLTPAERSQMPDSDTVWLAPLSEMLAILRRTGLRVVSTRECSRSHREVADSLIAAFEADAAQITSGIGSRALDELLAAHRLWSAWLGAGRVRKFEVVAQRPAVTDAYRSVARVQTAASLPHEPFEHGGR
jgi:hypothetical protein